MPNPIKHLSIAKKTLCGRKTGTAVDVSKRLQEERVCERCEAALLDMQIKERAKEAGIPAKLLRTGPRMTNEEARKLAEETSGRTRTWVPFKNYNDPAVKAAMAEARKPVIYVTNEDAPVTVSLKEGKEVKTLHRYPNMAAFRAEHDFGTYPFSRAIGTNDETIVVVSAKPWAGKEKAPAAPKVAGERGGKKTKLTMVAELLTRKEGCTREDILSTTGWPSVSVPAQAAAAGLVLRKEKIDGVTRYWGSAK